MTTVFQEIDNIQEDLDLLNLLISYRNDQLTSTFLPRIQSRLENNSNDLFVLKNYCLEKLKTRKL